MKAIEDFHWHGVATWLQHIYIRDYEPTQIWINVEQPAQSPLVQCVFVKQLQCSETCFELVLRGHRLD